MPRIVFKKKTGSRAGRGEGIRKRVDRLNHAIWREGHGKTSSAGATREGGNATHPSARARGDAAADRGEGARGLASRGSSGVFGALQASMACESEAKCMDLGPVSSCRLPQPALKSSHKSHRVRVLTSGVLKMCDEARGGH